jgi:hypothetical protein
MTLAHIGILAEHSTGEVTKSQDVLALCGINWNLAILRLEGITTQVLDDKLIFEEFHQSHTRIAVHPCAGTDTTEKDERLLHRQFQENAGVSKFTFRLVLNDEPAQWLAVIANRIHGESDHIDSIATESESCICIQLKYPTSDDLAKNIA